MPRFRFQAVIARKGSIQRAKSYQGRPRTRQQELELTESDVKTIAASLDGVPVCYNHTERDVLGRVERNWISPEGDWTVEASIDLDNPRREVMAQWIRDNKLTNVSLCHTMDSLRAKEVSLCFKGARPDTDVLGGAEVAASADSNATDYNLPDEDTMDTNEAITVVAASAMETTTTTTTPAAQDVAPAEVDTDAAFATTTEVSTILANPSRIPTSEEREQVRAKVSALELEKLKLADEKRLLEEQLQAQKGELERAVKEAEERGKKLSEEQKRSETEQQLAGDLIKTMAGNTMEDKDVQRVLASISKDEKALKFFADRGREYVAAAATPVDTIVENEVGRNMRAWKEYLQKRTVKPAPPATAPPAAAVDDAMQHPGVFKSLTPAVVQASYRPPPRTWGLPISQRRPEQDVAASSSSSYRYNYSNVSTKAEYEPGEGPNFYHGWMQSESQIDVYRDADIDKYGDRVSYKRLGMSTEAIQEHQLIHNRNDTERARRSQVAASSFNSNRLLLPSY